MGAISTHATFLQRLVAPNELKIMLKPVGIGSATGSPTSAWTGIGGIDAGVAPTTAVAPTRATTGALGQQNGGSGVLRLVQAKYTHHTTFPGTVFLYDRLSHQGGLDATVTSAQTTNLPTAALTRYTNGVGVQIALEVYSTIGSTGTTISVSYTNQAGVSGRISDGVVIGNTGFREVGRFIFVPLASGDTGVKSVESVTLAGTTGTAGAFGVVLFRPLLMMPYISLDYMADVSPLHAMGGFLPEIVDDACIGILFTSGTTNAGPLSGILKFSED